MGTLIGRLLDGRYRVQRELGRGGMATVYLALQESLDRPVVVKVPDPSLLQDEGFRKRFTREIHSMVSLPHPHVVEVLDAGEIDGVPYAILKYLQGGSLKDRLQARQGRETPREILSWLGPIARALDHIHQHGIVHRDVKPANILFDGAGNPFLSDFGIAKALGTADTNITRTGMTPGTPIYMAPEAGKSSRLTGASDQYALGVIVYEALSGLPPIQADTPVALLVKKLTEPPRSLHECAPDLPPALADVVMCALARDPEQRFPSCQAFAEAFDAALAGRVVTMPEVRTDRVAETGEPRKDPTGTFLRTPIPVSREPAKRRRLPLAAAGAALLVIASIVAIVLLDRVGNQPAGEPAAPPAVPRVVVETPKAGSVLPNTPTFRVAGRLEDLPGGHVEVNGISRRPGADGRFEVILTQESEGPLPVRVVPVDAEGREREAVAFEVAVDRTAPELEVREPRDGLVTKEASVTLKGRVSDAHLEEILVDGSPVPVRPDSTFETSVPLPGEVNAILVTAKDGAGNQTERSLVVTRAALPPRVVIETPSPNAVTGELEIRVAGSVKGVGCRVVRAEGQEHALGPDGTFAFTAPLPSEGANTLRVETEDAAGQPGSESVTVTRDTRQPVVVIDSPVAGEVVAATSVRVAGHAEDLRLKAVRVGGRPAAFDAHTGRFEGEAPLPQDGDVPIVVEADDEAGNTGTAERTVLRDLRPPQVALDALPAEVRTPTVTVRGTLDEDGCQVQVGGAAAAVDGRKFSRTVELRDGDNAIEVRAVDRAGNEATPQTVSVRRAVEPAAAPAAPPAAPAGGYPYAPDVESAVAALVERGVFGSPSRNPQGMIELLHPRTGLVFVVVPGGTFRMGSTESPAEQPVHDVEVKAFLMCRTECTQGGWERGGGVPGASKWKAADLPQESVAWDVCRGWCGKNGLRLPSEAEWEYACRAGEPGRWAHGADEASLAEYGWFDRNSGKQTHPVGQRRPNSWGLLDMHGNVWEWVEDAGHPSYAGVPAGSAAWTQGGGMERIIRGGSWQNPASMCRSAARIANSPSLRGPNLGFRPAADLK